MQTCYEIFNKALMNKTKINHHIILFNIDVLYKHNNHKINQNTKPQYFMHVHKTINKFTY